MENDKGSTKKRRAKTTIAQLKRKWRAPPKDFSVNYEPSFLWKSQKVKLSTNSTSASTYLRTYQQPLFLVLSLNLRLPQHLQPHLPQLKLLDLPTRRLWILLHPEDILRYQMSTQLFPNPTPNHLPRQHLPVAGHRRRNAPPPHRQRHRRSIRPGHQTDRRPHGV